MPVQFPISKLPHRFKAYGTGRTGTDGNVELCAFSETGFVHDLRTAKAVVAGGGYSLMGEAVHLHVPMYSVPIVGQYEQALNARYLEVLGYGQFGDRVDVDEIAAFLARTDEMAHKLESYVPRDNSMLFGCLDELLHDVAIDEPPPETLVHPAMGKWEGPALSKGMQRKLAQQD